MTALVAIEQRALDGEAAADALAVSSPGDVPESRTVKTAQVAAALATRAAACRGVWI
jgi:hypothetical protein